MPSRKPHSLEPTHDRLVHVAPEEDMLYDREAAERAPLLPRSDPGRSNQDESDNEDHSSTRSAFAVTIAISVLLMMADICNDIAMAPRMVIFEDIICRDYYAGTAGVADCKIEPVQSELARINGWKRTFTMLPGLALSIPYGALADRIGRSKVLSLALCGVLLNETWTTIVCAIPQVFPLRAIWFSGIFTILGGGPSTVVSMCYAIIGDACRPDQRTTAFSLIYAGFLISEMVSTPLGAVFIALNPWIPVLSAIGIRLGFTLFTIAVTVKYNNNTERLKDSPTDDQFSPAMSSHSPQRNVRDRVSGGIASLAGATTEWITKDVVLLLISFFLTQISRESSDILLQYSSLKFHWDYAKASYLIALRAGANMLVLFAIIPSISRCFRRKGIPSSQVDKCITIASGTVLVLGSLFIFFSSTPTSLIFGQTVIALGFAFTVTARSFLTTLAPTRCMGLLSTSVSVASHGAIVVGGPLLAWAFQVGLDLGDIWIGMPFLVNAVLFALGTIAVFCARSGNEYE